MLQEHLTQEQADEYAIGALEPGLERVVALHIAECAACRDVVRDAERLASSLAFSAPRRRPPARLRRRVWGAAGLTQPTFLERAMRFAPPAAAIIAAFVAVAAFTAMLSVRGQINDLRDNNANLQSQIDDVQSQKVELAAITQRLNEEELASNELRQASHDDRELLLAMVSPDSDVADATATGGHDPAIGRLVWDEQQKKIWFIANRLPPLGTDRTYQLWINSEGRFYSVGTFNADSTGYARFGAALPEGIDGYDMAVVTIEPSGGAPARSGDSVFVTNIADLRDQHAGSN